MANLNKQILIGRIGNFETKSTKNGKSVLEFSVATNEKWKNVAGAMQERTDWHKCIMFGERAEKIGSMMTKGMEVYVEGPTRHEEYEKKDGTKGYSTKVHPFVVQLFFGSGDETSDRAPQAKGSNRRTLEDPKGVDQANLALDQASFTENDIPY